MLTKFLANLPNVHLTASFPLSVLMVPQTCFLSSPRTGGGGGWLGRAGGRRPQAGAGLRVASRVSSRGPLCASASAEASPCRLSPPKQFPGRGSVLLGNEVVEDRVNGCTQVEKLQRNNVKVLRKVHHLRVFRVDVDDSANVERQPANDK